jgi:hypothetical protein
VVSSLVYFSHSYRPRDALINDYFARLMEAEGLIPSLDPPSVNVNSAKLERHLGYCDAMVVILTQRESGVSAHIFYEIALGLKAGKPTLVFVEDTLPPDIVPARVLQRRFSLRSFPRNVREHRQSLAILREDIGETPPRYQGLLTPRTCLLLGTAALEPAVRSAIEGYVQGQGQYAIISSAEFLAELDRHPIAYGILREIDVVIAFSGTAVDRGELRLLGIVDGAFKPQIRFAAEGSTSAPSAVPAEYHPRTLRPSTDPASAVQALATELGIYEEDFLELTDSGSADRYTQFLIDLGGRGRYSTLTRERGVEVVMGDRYNVHGQAAAVGPSANVHDVSFHQIWTQAGGDIDLPALADELARLRTTLRAEAETADHDRIVADVAQAELSAKRGDGPGALRHLQDVGKWALTTATNIGVGVAAAAIKAATGL